MDLHNPWIVLRKVGIDTLRKNRTSAATLYHNRQKVASLHSESSTKISFFAYLSDSASLSRPVTSITLNSPYQPFYENNRVLQIDRPFVIRDVIWDLAYLLFIKRGRESYKT